tara:strand:- start:81454 stop:82662 length:1209 start_codon:yes stop_codon:yes gene_type:complete
MVLKNVSTGSFWFLYIFPVAIFFILSSLWVYSYVNNTEQLLLKNNLEKSLSTFKFHTQRIESMAQFLQTDSSLKKELINLSAAVDRLDKRLTTQELEVLRESYQQALPALKGHKSTFNDWTKNDDLSRKMQYLYIAQNPYNIGKKDLLQNALDGSPYSQIHETVHASLNEVNNLFEFYDVLFIRKSDMRIIYSAEKEIDFGNVLKSGVYAQSPLGRVAHTVFDSPENGDIMFKPLLEHMPTQNNIHSFVSIPMYYEGELIGMLALQVSVAHYMSAFNEAMPADEENICWVSVDGLESGCKRYEENTNAKTLTQLKAFALATTEGEGTVVGRWTNGVNSMLSFSRFSVGGKDYVAIIQKRTKSMWREFVEFIAMSFIALSVAIITGLCLRSLIRPPEEKFTSI